MKFLLFLSEAAVPLIIFLHGRLWHIVQRPVFDDFIDGAKEGMKTVAGIMPTLIGLMTAVGVLRASGFFRLSGKMPDKAGCPPISSRTGRAGDFSASDFKLSCHRTCARYF